MRTIVLGLGNELLSDDAIGILVARRLRSELDDQVDVIESSLSGLALMDLLLGYDQAIIIDAITSGDQPPGTVIEMGLEDLRPVTSASPHYAGLPEMVDVAQKLGLDFPRRFKIFAIKAIDTETIGGQPSAEVMASMDEVVRRVKECVGQRAAKAI